MESPTSPASRVDFYDFLDRMRRPAAAGLFRSIKRSVDHSRLQANPPPPFTPYSGRLASPPDEPLFV